jgi:tRNA(Ile)-lysidine synthase
MPKEPNTMRIEEIFLQAFEHAADVLPPGATCVVGVSGGADSLTLLHLLWRYQEQLDIHPFVVHVNHGLRGAAAAADAAFVAATCAAWELPYRIRTVDVPALVRQYGFSVEEAARKARYTAFMEAARNHEARTILVAHQAADQAETVLLNLIRGAGLRGLRGMTLLSPLSASHLLLDVVGDQGELPFQILRPLLHVSRAAVEQYCEEHDLSPRTDQTNKDPIYTRNRIRHVVMPFLETINPNLTETLTRTADLVRAEVAYLDEQAHTLWERLRISEDPLVLERGAWQTLPLAMQREMLRRAAAHTAPQVEVGFANIEEARRIAAESEVNSLAKMGGGLRMRITHQGLLFTKEELPPPPSTIPLLPTHKIVALQVPGTVRLPRGLWQCEVAPYDGPRKGSTWRALLEEPWTAPFDAGKLRIPLFLRTREPGDRFRPHGVGGSQTMSTFMSNIKLAMPVRDRLPILLSGGRIAWVCGYRVDERFLVTEATQDIWLVRFTPQSS